MLQPHTRPHSHAYTCALTCVPDLSSHSVTSDAHRLLTKLHPDRSFAPQFKLSSGVPAQQHGFPNATGAKQHHCNSTRSLACHFAANHDHQRGASIGAPLNWKSGASSVSPSGVAMARNQCTHTHRRTVHSCCAWQNLRPCVSLTRAHPRRGCGGTGRCSVNTHR